MRPPRIGQIVDTVEVRRGQGQRGRIQPDVAIAVALHQRPRVAGVGFEMQHARGMGVEQRRAGDRFVRRQAHHRGLGREAGGKEPRLGSARVELGESFGSPPGRPDEGGAAQVGQLLGLLPASESVGDLDDLVFTIAEDQEVRLGVEENRAANLLGPVVEVGDAPQAGLDAAENDGYVGEGFAAALCIDDGRAVRAQPRPSVG